MAGRIFTDEERKKALETRRRNREDRKKLAISQNNNGIGITSNPSLPTTPLSSQTYVPTQTPTIETDAIKTKREQLELARMDYELKKLTDPPADTKMDYIEKLLTMQTTHNAQLLEMQKQNFETQLQVAKMEMGGEEDFADGVIKQLIPFAPQILAQLTSKSVATVPLATSSTGNDTTTTTVATETTEEHEMAEKRFIEQLKEDLKSGKLTKEQAFEDFQRDVPKSMSMFVTKNTFFDVLDKLIHEK